MVGILFLSNFMIFGLVPIWMGITKCDVVKDEENAFFKVVRVQWWFLMKKCTNIDERHLYQDYWNRKWKCNFANPE